MVSFNSPSAPHFPTIQPVWGDLRVACEILALREEETNWKDMPPLDKLGKSKINGVLTLFKRYLGVIDPPSGLTDRGRALLDAYQPTATTGDERAEWSELQLTIESQELLWEWIWEAHAVPMVAALHQVKSERTPDGQSAYRAYGHYARIEHLENYRSIAVTSHRFRAKIQFRWLKQLEFVTTQNNCLKLSNSGEAIYGEYKDQYPDRWDEASDRASCLVNEYETHKTQSRMDRF